MKGQLLKSPLKPCKRKNNAGKCGLDIAFLRLNHALSSRLAAVQSMFKHSARLCKHSPSVYSDFQPLKLPLKTLRTRCWRFKLICNFSLVNQTEKNNILKNEIQLRNEPQKRNGQQLRNGLKIRNGLQLWNVLQLRNEYIWEMDFNCEMDNNWDMDLNWEIDNNWDTDLNWEMDNDWEMDFNMRNGK